MVVVSAAVSSQDLWYVSRGSGLVLLAALSIDVAVGIGVRKGGRLPGLPRFATERLHRDLSLLAGLLTLLHVATAILDPYAGIGWIAAVVPLHSPYRPVWIGLGALSLDVGMAVVLTSLVRSRLPYRAWRVVHALVYLAWPFAVAHSLQAGTDTRLVFVSATLWGCVGLVAVALAWRIAGRPAQPAAPGAPGAPGAAAGRAAAPVRRPTPAGAGGGVHRAAAGAPAGHRTLERGAPR